MRRVWAAFEWVTIGKELALRWRRIGGHEIFKQPLGTAFTLRSLQTSASAQAWASAPSGDGSRQRGEPADRNRLSVRPRGQADCEDLVADDDECRCGGALGRWNDDPVAAVHGNPRSSYEWPGARAGLAGAGTRVACHNQAIRPAGDRPVRGPRLARRSWPTCVRPSRTAGVRTLAIVRRGEAGGEPAPAPEGGAMDDGALIRQRPDLLPFGSALRLPDVDGSEPGRIVAGTADEGRQAAVVFADQLDAAGDLQSGVICGLEPLHAVDGGPDRGAGVPGVPERDEPLAALRDVVDPGVGEAPVIEALPAMAVARGQDDPGRIGIPVALGVDRLGPTTTKPGPAATTPLSSTDSSTSTGRSGSSAAVQAVASEEDHTCDPSRRT